MTEIKLPKSTPKGVKNMIEYLQKDRDDERDARYRIEAFLDKNHPEWRKEYNDSRLYESIFGGQVK